MGYSITCDTGARGWPGTPRGLSPLLPVPGLAVPRSGWVILGRSRSQGVPSLGAALISELLSKQGRAAALAVPVPHPGLCRALPPALPVHSRSIPGPSAASGGRSHGGSSSVSPGLWHSLIPASRAPCPFAERVFPVVPCQGCTRPWQHRLG